MPYAIKLVNVRDEADCYLSGRFARRREAQAVMNNPHRFSHYCLAVFANVPGNGQYQARIVWTP